MFRSKLVQRFSLVIVLIITLFSMAVYLYSVPLIKDTVFAIEQNASRIALNNVFELANKMYFNVETYRQQALDAQKRHLRTVVTLAEAYVSEAFNDVEQGYLTEQQARQRVFEGLRRFTYGNNDYIWVASHDAQLLSHPDPRFHGADASTLRSSDGEIIIPHIIQQARAGGDGFYQYKWRRLGAPEEIDKISYFKDFPQWGLVIGSGLYLDDIEAEVQQRTQAAVAEMREALAQIKIAKTGYLYIFDSRFNMLIHPNPNLDGINFRDQRNPVTHNSIAEELVKVADTGREHFYKWDKPSDPGNYVYDKLSLVRHLDGFDWYIGSSVYVDELRRSSEVLSERIMTITLVALAIATVLAFFFVSRFASPINRLAATAARVSDGDLTAQSGIRRDDELGVLARTFDDMVQRLSGNIQTLDLKVRDRTRELEESNVQLRAAVESQLQAQQELAAIEERQRMILDALPAQIAYVGSDLRYRFVNQGYADMFSMSKEAIVGKAVSEVMGEQILIDVREQIERSLRGEETQYEYRFQRGDSEMITKRILIPHLAADGSVNGLLNLSLDITAEKETERKLSEAQRMHAVGQLAGGLAHDFNNLLTIILGNLTAALDRFQNVEGLANNLLPAIRASRRGADITSRMLSFSRRQPLTPIAVDIEALIADSIALVKDSLPCNIDIHYQGSGAGCQAYADPSQLENALVNLALNARDAMPKGGALRFEVCVRHIRGPVVYDEPVEAGDYVEILVQDSGEGFAADSLQRAFEPFYTTKSGGAGSGLGLSMVYGFVKQSRGYIRLDSEPGHGARVSLLLPTVPINVQPAAQERDGGDRSAADFSGKLMLLVEDDSDVRAVIRNQLTAMGFGVLEAGDADEALALIDSLDGFYGMVSDVMMPGSVDGFDLARTLKQRRPDCTIVLISGYSYEKDPAGEGAQSFTLLRKPFEQDALRQAILQAEACID